ncbi:MAG: hypothetical protein MUE44_10120 [Oscillatoriaceae cyanobacterium Prado104]|nr:hypothetical protein [Oscillatoriaceae cyanobacterium Prado104]
MILTVNLWPKEEGTRKKEEGKCNSCNALSNLSRGSGTEKVAISHERSAIGDRSSVITHWIN